jgi:hypothetical protein
MFVKWGFNHQKYGTTDESRVDQTQIGESVGLLLEFSSHA